MKVDFISLADFSRADVESMLDDADRLKADLVVTSDTSDKFQANLNVSLRERLVSRLTEMQTRDYLTQPHLP